MALTIEEVKKLAVLSRLNLTPEEEKRHAETISVVLEYMKVLNEVDTEGVELTAQVTGLKNVVREDQVVKSGLHDQLVKAFPATKEEELLVPAVFSNNGEE